MLLLCALFALLTVGFVVPCVIDIAMTPSALFDVPSKKMWLTVAICFWAFGAATWLLIGRREVRMRAAFAEMSGGPLFADERGFWGSPSWATLGSSSSLAGRQPQLAMTPMRFVPPDDNPDFLVELDRRIRDLRDEA
jgi:hypothetical protein